MDRSEVVKLRAELSRLSNEEPELKRRGEPMVTKMNRKDFLDQRALMARDQLAHEAEAFRNKQPSMIDNVRAARDARHGKELVAVLRDHNAAVVNLRDSAADEIERLLPSPAPSPKLQDVREALQAIKDAALTASGMGVALYPQDILDHANRALTALTQSDAQPDRSLIKGERGGISWGGSFYIEGNRESIDEVREMMFAKARCEAFDKMISEKQLVRAPHRPDASGLIEAADMAHQKAIVMLDGKSAAELFELEDELRSRAADRSAK